MIIIPANLETIKTLKDGTIQLCFETQELKPAAVGKLFSYRNKLGYLAFKPELFEREQLDLIKSLKTDDIDNEKSDSKRMRNVFFRLWEQNDLGYKDFNLYYSFRMNDLIKMLKNEFEK
jgi:hypothetical protein